MTGTQPASQEQASAPAIAAAVCAAAGIDFDEVWASGRIRSGGTQQADRNLFVLGAAYGLAWAMRYLEFDGAGGVELLDDELMIGDDVGDEIDPNRGEESQEGEQERDAPLPR